MKCCPQDLLADFPWPTIKAPVNNLDILICQNIKLLVSMEVGSDVSVFCSFPQHTVPQKT